MIVARLARVIGEIEIYIYLYNVQNVLLNEQIPFQLKKKEREREEGGYYRCMKSFHFSRVSRDVLCRGYVTRLQNGTTWK